MHKCKLNHTQRYQLTKFIELRKEKIEKEGISVKDLVELANKTMPFLVTEGTVAYAAKAVDIKWTKKKPQTESVHSEISELREEICIVVEQLVAMRGMEGFPLTARFAYIAKEKVGSGVIGGFIKTV